MGQKVSPHGLRVGIIKDWDSVWYAEKDFANLLLEDNNIRKYIKKKLFQAGISKVVIRRSNTRVGVTIHVNKPGVIIGRNGQAIAELTAELQKFVKNPASRVAVDIVEIRFWERDAQLVAEDVAKQLENRVTFRRAMKQAMTKVMRMGAQGVKLMVAGRLGGADIARSESYHDGTIPLATLRADIDYGFAEAATTYGRIGVKVWIYKGEVLPTMRKRREDRPEGRSDRRYDERPGNRSEGRPDSRPDSRRDGRSDSRQGSRQEGGMRQHAHS